MGNTICLKSVSELLGLNFFIPSYQRGYRWDTKQVQELLDDIYDYTKQTSKAEKEFYCLQPIVVVKCEDKVVVQNKLNSDLDGNIWYEVIDGQQRLTTLRILFSYLIHKHFNGSSLENEYGKSLFRLEYETRGVSANFLDNIKSSKETMDAFFISEAYNYIEKWFIEKVQQRDVRESMLRTLIKDMTNKNEEGVVQVIWYEINQNEVKPIDTFVRVNMGKIPLNNAELIKALFLQNRNFSNPNTAMFRQIEIANEWDRMEYKFQEKDFWWFINKDNNEKPARIEFLFDMMHRIAKRKNSKLKEVIGDDKYSTFRYFNILLSENNTINHITKKWDEVKDHFQAFEEWFDNPIWHNYIGFLIYSGMPVESIYDWYRESDKSEFTKRLKKEIVDKVSGIDCEKKRLLENKSVLNNIDGIVWESDRFLEKERGNEQSENYTYQINLSYSSREQVRQLLLLYNIQYAINQIEAANKEGKSDQNAKFPFERFKNEKWDVEHIDSYTQNPIQTKQTQVEWLRTSAIDIGNQFNENLVEQIMNFITTSKTSQEDFNRLYMRIADIAKENHKDSEEKNSISNLTLLDAKTNRSYGNALFLSKRRIIIERDTEGQFIPLCTKNVFMKYYDKNVASLTEWSDKDMVSYQNHIATTLSDFLKFK
jgi:uncharacterized protein with ParB-like and HNH nuclease domain